MMTEMKMHIPQRSFSTIYQVSVHGLWCRATVFPDHCSYRRGCIKQLFHSHSNSTFPLRNSTWFLFLGLCVWTVSLFFNNAHILPLTANGKECFKKVNYLFWSISNFPKSFGLEVPSEFKLPFLVLNPSWVWQATYTFPKVPDSVAGLKKQASLTFKPSQRTSHHLLLILFVPSPGSLFPSQETFSTTLERLS